MMGRAVVLLAAALLAAAGAGAVAEAAAQEAPDFPFPTGFYRLADEYNPPIPCGEPAGIEVEFRRSYIVSGERRYYFQSIEALGEGHYRIVQANDVEDENGAPFTELETVEYITTGPGGFVTRQDAPFDGDGETLYEAQYTLCGPTRRADDLAGD